MAMAKSDVLRVVSFTLAGADILQTMPATYRFYKKQWTQRRISAVCFFYACVRYITLISLVSNGYGAWSTNFTPESCQRYYMLPNITAVLGGMAVQALVFIRTWAISKRSNIVFYFLGAVLLLDLPVQVFGIVYHREPSITNGNCKGKVLAKGEPDWNIVYYIAHMVFDIMACTTATVCLLWTSKEHGIFNTSRFVRRIWRHGLLFTFVVVLCNLLVVMEFTGATKTGIGAALPLAIVMIAAQHLILGTQQSTSDHPSSTSETSRSRSRSFGQPSRGRPGPSYGRRTRDIELEVSTPGVFVLTETYNDVQTDHETKTGMESQEEPGADHKLPHSPTVAF
ncbi:hypothetical protein C8J56DRAFT_954664, partial [Mycena floridula]